MSIFRKLTFDLAKTVKQLQVLYENLSVDYVHRVMPTALSLYLITQTL